MVQRVKMTNCCILSRGQIAAVVEIGEMIDWDWASAALGVVKTGDKLMSAIGTEMHCWLELDVES